MTEIEVRQGEGTASGLAQIVSQFLQQDLAEFEAKRRRASRLRGRVALTDSEHDVSVTLDFQGDCIVIADGSADALDATIAGPHRELVRLLQGRTSAIASHLRGDLRVRSSWRKPFFPLQVHRLMRISGEGERAGTWAYVALASLLVAGAAWMLLK